MRNLFKLSLRNLLISLLLIMLFSVGTYSQEVRKLTFVGTVSETKINVKDFNPALPSDWTGYTHLVMEIRTSSPQRFSIWLYRADGTPVRVLFQPFGQNVWFRASLPLQYFEGRDKSGTALASTTNRRTNTFWYSVWGPFGKIKSIEAIGFMMPYPINNPTVELRAVHLSNKDEGSEYLEKTPVLDEFNQWKWAEWPGKLKSKEQLAKELADEEKTWGSSADYNYCEDGGYKNTMAKATGFFHVEQIDGKWWFIDPHGHLFLSTGANGAGAGFGNRPGGTVGAGAAGAQRTGQPGQAGNAGNVQQPAANAPATNAPAANPPVDRITPRLKAWGMTTGGRGMPYTVMMSWGGARGMGQGPRQGQAQGQGQPQVQPQVQGPTQGPNFLGLPDVYSPAFEASVDQSANTRCTPLKDDPLLLGYFIGNEPAFDGRETELVDMILAGPASATQTKLKEFLTQGDTPDRRKEFVYTAFERYLNLACSAIKKYDPNHITLGIRFGGSISDELLRTARVFDVCSINVYEYEPMWQIDRASRYTGRPILLGEFHIGVPANGLGAGLVQAKDQTERGVAYRFFMEQAASLSSFVGAYWFEWRDEPVLGRGDGENYNIGFVDVNDRPYKELVEAAKATNKRLFEVHSSKIPPFIQMPKASDYGTPSSPFKF